MEDQKLYETIGKTSNRTVEEGAPGTNRKNRGGRVRRMRFRRAIIAAVSVWIMATILIMPACTTVDRTTEPGSDSVSSIDAAKPKSNRIPSIDTTKPERNRVPSINISDIIPGIDTPGVVIQYSNPRLVFTHDASAPQTMQAVFNGTVYQGEYSYSYKPYRFDRKVDAYCCKGDIVAVSANEGDVRISEWCYLIVERETGTFRGISFPGLVKASPDSEHTLTQDDALKMATSIASQYVEIDSCTIETSDHLFVFTDYGGYNDFSAFAFAFTNQNTNSRIEIRITKEGYLSAVIISGG